ncbi:MAG: LLM class flavin-dependent oxidoreductase [Candidatus Binatia bacterium]|nr:LLM class flavin-dependent oxidoreductase [Candidatus Binatia bacterium]
MLDNMSGGRLILGLGRGLGRVEFEGFGVDMNTSRTRFVEYAEMLLRGLEDGFLEYDGEYLKQERREIRPRPFKSCRRSRTPDGAARSQNNRTGVTPGFP